MVSPPFLIREEERGGFMDSHVHGNDANAMSVRGSVEIRTRLTGSTATDGFLLTQKCITKL